MCKQCNIVETNSGLKNASLDEIEIIARNIRKIGGGIVLLTGGEPFLRKDLPEIVEIFKKNKYMNKNKSIGIVLGSSIAPKN